MIRRTLTVLAVVAGAMLATSSPVQSEQPRRAPGAVQPVQVTVVDDTRGQWPGLEDAVVGWNASPYVHLRLATACTPGTYCTVVRAAQYGATTWGARATPPTLYRAALVVLNTTYAYGGADWMAAAACHELGHALGVPHISDDAPAGQSGCIAGSDRAHGTITASDADLQALYAAWAGVRGEGWGAVYSAHPQA